MITVDGIIEMLAEAFNIESSDLTVDSKRDDIEEWDSMGMLMLMAELDERFEIVLEEEELAELACVQDVVDLIRAKGKLAA